MVHDSAGRRARLRQLTARWQARREAQRREPAAAQGERPRADLERQARAMAHFPYRSLSPDEYAERYGADMPGFTYDEYAYDDPALDAWLLELGSALRRRRSEDD